MTCTATASDESTIITVKVTRQEYPELFVHLMTIEQGKRRANRLRVLADKGLTGSGWQAPAAMAGAGAPSHAAGGELETEGAGAAALTMFTDDWQQ